MCAISEQTANAINAIEMAKESAFGMETELSEKNVCKCVQETNITAI